MHDLYLIHKLESKCNNLMISLYYVLAIINSISFNHNIFLKRLASFQLDFKHTWKIWFLTFTCSFSAFSLARTKTEIGTEHWVYNFEKGFLNLKFPGLCYRSLHSNFPKTKKC